MGFSSFWHSLTGHKVKEMAPPKQSDGSHSQHQRDTERNTHPASRQNNTPWDEPSQHVEPVPRRAKRRSVWRPSQSSTIEEPIIGGSDKKAKRRSFWRSEPQQPEFRMYAITSPGVPAVSIEHRAAQPDVEQRKQSGQSLMNQPDAEQKKQNRQSVMSMASVKSNKSNRSRKKRLSFFGGRMDDDDSDDDVPDVPALPTTVPTAVAKNLPYQRRRDMGSNLGMRGSDEHVHSPGMAITSDEFHNTALPSMDSKQKRQSKRLSTLQPLSQQKSTNSQKSNNSGKSKRRSWFSSSNPDDGDAVPPVPALGFDNMPSPNTDSTFESSFERFLVTAHKNAPGSNKVIPTDFEQFLQESADYDAAKSSRFGHRGDDVQGLRSVSTIASANRRGSYAGPRNAVRSFRMSTTQASPAVRHSWRHSQYGSNSTQTKAEGTDIVCMSAEQQKEWEKFKELMDVREKKEDDGVMGMLRQFEEEEEEDQESWPREEKRGRNRDSRAVYENTDALAALEFGVAK